MSSELELGEVVLLLSSRMSRIALESYLAGEIYWLFFVGCLMVGDQRSVASPEGLGMALRCRGELGP